MSSSSPVAPTLRGAQISGLGVYVPEKIVTNADLEKLVDTSDEWIVSRTGIRERRMVAENQATSDLAVLAARDALKSSGLDISQIELILVATSTGDFNALPATAALVQERLGAKNVAAFDMSAACAGFAYAVDLAHQYIATGRYDNILVVGAETMTRVVDWTDRNTCILFGDGAGAVVMTPCAYGDGILSSVTGADGSGACLLYVPAGGSRQPLTALGLEERQQFLFMRGKEVYKFAVEIMGEAAVQALTRANLTPADVDLFVPHQANIRIIAAAAKRMELPPEKVVVNVDRFGNTSAASIPLALFDAWSDGRLSPGKTIVTVGFGAGLTWGANVIRWTLPNPNKSGGVS